MLALRLTVQPPNRQQEEGKLFEERLLAGVAALDVVAWVQIRAVKKTAGVLRVMQVP